MKPLSPILSIRNLKVRLGEGPAARVVINDFSTTIAKRQTVALVGESGSGKTLTALAILGLLPRAAAITTGEIEFDGRGILGLPERELCKLRGNRIAMIFQEPERALNPLMPAGEQIAEVIRLHYGLGRRTAAEQVLALMELVGIPDPPRRYHALPHQLSAGIQQRVVIASALACRPDLLLADEPTSSLDNTVQAQIVDLLGRLIADLGMSVLLIAHDLTVVAALADRVVVMYKGTVLEEGPTGEIFREPLHPYTRELMSVRPLTARKAPPEGALRLPLTLPAGPPICPYAEVCAAANNTCSAERPPLVPIDATRSVRCHFGEKLHG